MVSDHCPDTVTTDSTEEPECGCDVCVENRRLRAERDRLHAEIGSTLDRLQAAHSERDDLRAERDQRAGWVAYTATALAEAMRPALNARDQFARSLARTRGRLKSARGKSCTLFDAALKWQTECDELRITHVDRLARVMEALGEPFAPGLTTYIDDAIPAIHALRERAGTIETERDELRADVERLKTERLIDKRQIEILNSGISRMRALLERLDRDNDLGMDQHEDICTVLEDVNFRHKVSGRAETAEARVAELEADLRQERYSSDPGEVLVPLSDTLHEGRPMREVLAETQSACDAMAAVVQMARQAYRADAVAEWFDAEGDGLKATLAALDAARGEGDQSQPSTAPAAMERLQAAAQSLADRLSNHCLCGGLPGEADGSCECTDDLNALGAYWALDAPAPPPRDPNRCGRCGWPLAESREDGCVRGDCSMRGEQLRNRANWYDAERYEREREESRNRGVER